jgi:hypothetical protein
MSGWSSDEEVYRPVQTDPDFKARVILYGGTLINVVFALFKLISGIAVRSYWFGAIAIYYLMLSVVKLVLIRRDRARLKSDRGGDYEWRSYRVAGWLMLALSVTLTGIVYQVVAQGKSYSYPGFLIFAVAAYSFYNIVVTVVRLVKGRGDRSPIFTAVYTIDFSAALVAMFALQTAMLSAYSSPDYDTTPMNGIFGGMVSVAVIVLAVIMIIRAYRNIE